MDGRREAGLSEKAGTAGDPVLFRACIPELQSVSTFFGDENITDAPIKVQKRKKEEVYAEAKVLLEKMGLSDRADAYPYQLSGGQQQRVSIARALAMKPQMLFFDEPTSALDPELTGEILKVIKNLAAEHMTMVIVTHEMNFAKNVADKIIFMDKGVIAEQGTPKEVFSSGNARMKEFLGKLEND